MRLPTVCALASLVFAAACGEKGLTPAERAALDAAAPPSRWEVVDQERAGARRRDPRTGIVFVLVPAGTFVMGGDVMPAELPRHRVQLTKAFWLSETEVTIAQWQHHVAEHHGDPSVPVPADDAQSPMPVSWQDATLFCELYGYRLPTEAEWERACRGGLEPDAEPWRRDEGLVQYAWCHRNTKQVHPVRTREPNTYGLFDMLGNVWEWCGDAWSPAVYQGRPDPAVDPVTRDGDGRVLRGGSWFTTPTAGASTRSAAPPAERSPFFGFRPARTAE